MKQTKREYLPLYSYFDRSGIAVHLEDMAAQGWMLEKLGTWCWRYRRIEPKNLRVTVTFFPTATQFDPLPSQGLETYRDYCAQAGWLLAADSAQVQVFYSEDPDAVPIETDPAAELANIHRCMKRSFLASYWGLLALSLLQIIFSAWRVWTDPIGILSSHFQLATLFAWWPEVILVSVELTRYYRWRHRAKEAVEASLPLPELRSWRKLSLLILVLCGVQILVLLLTSITRNSALIIFSLLCYGLMFFLADAARKAMRHLKFKPWLNLLITMGVIIALTVAMMAGILALILSGNGDLLDHDPGTETYEYRGITWTVHHDHIPLRLEDLTEVHYDQWSTQAEVDSSFLLAHGQYSQDPRMDALDQLDLDYEITWVKVPLLYDFCKQNRLDRAARNNDQLPQEYWDEYRLIDAPGWKAEEVYQLYRTGVPTRKYLVCWPDRFVEIRFGEIPTEAQIAIAAEKLKNA